MFRRRFHRSQSQRLSRACFETLEGRRLLSFSVAVNYASGGAYTPGIVTADFNKDGNLDLATAVGYSFPRVSVRLGNGAGSFGAAQDYAMPGYDPASIFVADFNNDTRPDILASDGGTAYILVGNGDGTFQSPINTGGGSVVAVGRFNGDNNIDVMVTWLDDDWNPHVQVYSGNGQGQFAPAPDASDGYYWGWGGIAAVDLNKDGHIDVGTGEGFVLLGYGNGALQWFNWQQPAPLGSGRAVAAGDFNDDGNADLISAGGDVAVLRGRGDGTWDAPIHSSVNGYHPAVATADFNADGKLDAIVTDSNRATVSVMLGNGDGTMGFAGAFATGTSPSAITVGDFNGDDRPDVAVANRDSANFSVLLNDGNWAIVPPAPPTVSVGDTTVTEGDTGTLNATFAVTLVRPAAIDVTVSYQTTNINATELSDFVATSGTLTIPAGETSRTIMVPIKGDLVAESTETFRINLSNATGAPIADGEAIGTIIDNDTPSSVIISNVSRAEGSSGTTQFTFTVSLSSASAQDSSVKYATAGGSAISTSGNRDFVSTSGTLSFPAGVTSKSVTVSVVGDTRVESDETFFLNLSQPVGVTVGDGQGVGTILNDDSGRGKKWVGPASGGNWSTASNWSPSGVPTADSLVTLAGAAVTLAASATVSELSLNAGASLTVAQSGNRVFRTAGLFLDDASATLDLRDNDMILDYAPGNSSPLGGVSGLIAHGYNYSAWDGSGVVTRTTDAANGLTTLAPVEAAELLGLTGSQTAQWDGQSVDATSVLIKYTYAGDLNFDGLVDGADYGTIDNWVQFPATSGYTNGDFNLDGVIDGADYGLIDNAIQFQGLPL